MTDTDTFATKSPVPFEQTNLCKELQTARRRHGLPDLSVLPVLDRVPPLRTRLDQALQFQTTDDVILECFRLWNAAMLDAIPREDPTKCIAEIIYYGLYSALSEAFEDNEHLVNHCPETTKAFLRTIVTAWLKSKNDYHADFMTGTLIHLAFTNERMAKCVSNALRHGGFNHMRFQKMRRNLEGREQRQGEKAVETSRQLVTALNYAAFSSLGPKGLERFGMMMLNLDNLSEGSFARVMKIFNQDWKTRHTDEAVRSILTKDVQQIPGLWPRLAVHVDTNFQADDHAIDGVTIDLRPENDRNLPEGYLSIMDEIKTALTTIEAIKKLKGIFGYEPDHGRIHFCVRFWDLSEEPATTSWTV